MKKNTQSNSAEKKPKSIKFLEFPQICDFKGFPSILEVAILHEIPLNHSCGGMGSCTTCRIFVTKGAEKLNPRNEVEAEHAQMRGYAPDERLACQTLAVDGLEIQIPPETTTAEAPPT